MLEFSIEKFDKYIDDHPIKDLIRKNENGICQSPSYSEIMAEVSTLSLNMKIQFENAKKEFTSEGFLARIKKGNVDLMEVEEVFPDDEKKGKGKPKKKTLIGKMVSMFGGNKKEEE